MRYLRLNVISLHDNYEEGYDVNRDKIERKLRFIYQPRLDFQF